MDTQKIITLADWKPSKQQIKNVKQVLKTGRLSYGPFSKELEAKFASKHNFKHAIFMNSGTSALEIAWLFMKNKYGWKDGSEVIIPATTFVATANMIIHAGLKPVLVDIDFHNFNIDPQLIELFITNRTVAICPVDLLGLPCDIEAIKEIAKKYQLKIIEDACETMFVNHPNGKPVGSEADIAVYSSYLAHIISTGVGGFLCTNNKKDEEIMRSMIWHGRDNLYLNIDANKDIPLKKLIPARFRFNQIGFSMRLTEMEAALGVDEIDRAENIIMARQINATILQNLLSEFVDYLILPDLNPNNAWMFFPIICDDRVNRNKLVLFLEKRGIQTRSIMPLLDQPVYKGMWNPEDYIIANWINEQGFLIGIHHFLTKKDLKYIAKTIGEYFDKT